jgi:hypothetical protein
VICGGSWQLLIAVFEGGFSPAEFCPTLSTHIFYTFSIELVVVFWLIPVALSICFCISHSPPLHNCLPVTHNGP